MTRIGKLELRIERDHSGKFSTALFGRYARSEKALVAAVAEMYVQGRRHGRPLRVQILGERHQYHQRGAGPEIAGVSTTPTRRTLAV